MASIVNFYRGPQSQIDAITELEDGRIYFATDSKKIQMDCVHTDSLNNRFNKRITFGGSTGIYYGKKAFGEDELGFFFTMDDLDTEETELPSEDDLILNSDGSFYRVTTVHQAQGQVETIRLTLSGSGGGGGGQIGMIYRTYISDRISYFTMQDTDIPIIFSCYSSMDDSPVTAEIVVNDISMGHIENIKKDQAVTVNLTDYKLNNILKTNTSNTIKINLRDDYDNTATMTYTVYLYDMYINISDTQVMPQPSDYEFVGKPYGGTSGNLTNRSIIFELRREGSESILWSETYVTNADKGENISYLVPHQEHGTYILTIYLKAGIPNSTKFLTSPPKTVQIPFYNASESAPLITVSNAPVNELTQYDKVKIGYMITYAAATTSSVNLIIEIDRGAGRELLRSTNNTIPNGEYKYWDVSFDEPGIYYLTIELAGSEYSKSLQPVSVVEYKKGDIPTIETGDASLRLLLSSKNRSNTETNKDVWESKFGSSVVSAQFSGFNWNTNGWIADAQGAVALHLTNGAKVVIPYSPFAPDDSNNGAEKTGRTIELDFKISNIRDLSKPCITCKSSSYINDNGVLKENINTGIQIYGNKSQMNSLAEKSSYDDMSGWTTMFKEGSRIHLTYVINSTTDNPARIFYTFLNGVTSSLSQYASSDQFVDLPSAASEFVFDSTYMDIDIYNIRVYSLSKTPTFVLKNYIADSATPEIAATKWIDNNMLNTMPDNATGIDLDIVKNLGNIPYMVFYDGRQTGGKKDDGWQETDPEYDGTVYPVTDESRLPTSKKDYRHMEIQYVDPENPENNIPEGTIVSCYAQGTSSLEYPVKNLRIYFKDKAGYALFDDVPAVRLYTLKADYMESASAHNTGTANVLNKLYKSIGLKSPAADAYPATQNMLTAILGKPIVCFYKPYKSSGEYPDYYKYIGRYNFNYDKATHEIFGFESLKANESANNKAYGYAIDEEGNLRDGFNTALEVNEENDMTYYRIPSKDATEDQIVFIAANDEDAFEDAAAEGPLYEYKTADKGVTTIQCWEFLNNTSPLVGFREPWIEEVDAKEVKNAEGKVIHKPYQDWTGAFESRYPEHTDEASSDKRSMARVVNWLYSTNRHPDVVTAALEEVGIEATPENIETERANRLNKFKNEFNNYFLKDFVAFYYVLTETLMMIDSRGKNMMFACFDADPENPDETKRGHWLPIFYDMDTMLGVDNSGNLRFAYDAEDDLPDTFNLTATYNETQYSVLWCNYKEAFFNDIKKMYQDLRQGGVFNYSAMLNNYNASQANAWNETYINEDANFKYINPLVSEYEVFFDAEGNLLSKEDYEELVAQGKTEGITSKTAVDYLYAAQGTRSEHRAYWLENRFNYLDSKYDYVHEILQTNGAPLSVRLNSSIEKSSLPFNADQTLTSQYEQYVTIQHLNGAYEGPVRMHAGEMKTISVPITTSTDQECYIFGLDSVSDMGIQADKYYNKFQLQKVVKLRSLENGCFVKGWENANLGKVNTYDIAGKVPYLEYLNLQNCSGLSAVLDMAQSPYLQEIYAYGTNLTSVNFFNGGNLKHVELPATTNRLLLRDQLYFDTFTLRTDEEVEEIREREYNKIKNSIIASMTKLKRSEAQIQNAIDAIELTEIQREHLTFAGYNYLTTLRISNCPLVDSKGFIKKLLRDNGDDTYSTNLQNFRMEDVNWTIKKSECVLQTNGTQVQVKNVPLLDILASINGLDNADKLASRAPAGNDYFAGTITFDNEDDTWGIDELTLYNLYGKLFPGLTFKYKENSHCTKAYFIGINNALNQVEQMYSKKCSADDIDNIASTLVDWFTPATDENGNWDTTHVPPLPKSQSGKYEYSFVGWSLEPQATFNEDAYTNAEERLAAAQAVCSVIVTKQDDTYSARLNNFVFNENSFNEQQEIHFYPVYEGIIRFYPVYFLWKKDGVDTELKKELVKYGYAATPPKPPLWMELPDDDVTAGYIHPFTGYNIPYNDVRNEVRTYAQFGEKVHMNISPTDESYFANVGKGDEIEDGITLQLRKDFMEEALTVPKTFEGKTVLTFQIEDHAVNAPNLKRIFFEKGNNIIRLNNIRSGQDTFEYCDFKELTKLKVIEAACFTSCANLICTMLPENLKEIQESAFSNCTKLSISKLPQQLYFMGSHVFDGCSNIKQIDINNSSLNAISEYAFHNCENLTVKTENINCSITAVGAYAFSGCSSLVMNFGQSGEDCSIEELGNRTFRGTPNLNIQNLPARLKEIPSQCFYGVTTGDTPAKFTVIPASVTKIGSYAFQFRVLSDSIRIENSQIEIDPNAFTNAKGLKTIYVPESMVINTDNAWGSGATIETY